MVNCKQRCAGLACLIAAYFFTACPALACPPVAKVVYYTKADAKAVEVIRAPASSSERLPADMLCSGDKVKVAKGGRITIKYLTKDILETELRGEAELPIYSIKTNTQLSNLKSIVADIGKWFQHVDNDASIEMVTRGSIENSKSVIRSPLARGEGFEYPFILHSDLKNLHFFWRGGAAPWQAEILNKDGGSLIGQEVSQPAVRLSLVGIKSNESYILSIRSSDGKHYQKQLLFRDANASEETSDHLRTIMDLLYLDAEDNWRLQLWSYLQEQENSSIKSTLLRHLEKDDL